jgi:hypothetical protein
MQLYSELIAMNKDTRLRFKEAINVFQGPIGCLWVQEIRSGYEGKTNNGPDNPELVPKVLDAWKCSLHNAVVAYPVSRFRLLVPHYKSSAKLKRTHGERCAFRSHLKRINPRGNVS